MIKWNCAILNCSLACGWALGVISPSLSSSYTAPTMKWMRESSIIDWIILQWSLGSPCFAPLLLCWSKDLEWIKLRKWALGRVTTNSWAANKRANVACRVLWDTCLSNELFTASRWWLLTRMHQSRGKLEVGREKCLWGELIFRKRRKSNRFRSSHHLCPLTIFTWWVDIKRGVQTVLLIVDVVAVCREEVDFENIYKHGCKNTPSPITLCGVILNDTHQHSF